MKSLFKPEYADQIIELMSKGLSLEEVARHWGVNVSTVRDWSEDPRKPLFVKAYKLAKEAEYAAWLEIGRKITCGEMQKASGPTYMYLMAKKFGGQWAKNNDEHVADKTKDMSNDELTKLIKSKLSESKSIFSEQSDIPS